MANGDTFEERPTAAAPSGSDRRGGIAEDLRRALPNGNLAVEYQEVVDLGTRRAVMVEALLRWDDPRLGRIPPRAFVPVAESAGFVHELDRFAFEAGCGAIAAWRAALGEHLTLALNCSATTLGRHDALSSLLAIADRHGVAYGSIVIELTENAPLSNTGYRNLCSLVSMGVSVVLDEFGSGHNGLPYLQRLPVAGVKLDGMLVRSAPEQRTSQAIIRALVHLAEELSLSLVAEGVETEAQEHVISELGVRLVQGFRYHRPTATPDVALPEGAVPDGAVRDGGSLSS